MADTTSAQLFELWRKQMEDGAQAWTRMLAQTPSAPVDPTGFWRPIVQQSFDTWAKLLAQGPIGPDLLTQWKQLADQTIETWSRILGQVMGTEAFAQLMGRTLDAWLVPVGPVKRVLDPATENAVKALGLASRTQLTSVATQIVDLEERIEHLEDGVSAVLRRLDQVLKVVSKRGAAPAGAEREGT